MSVTLEELKRRKSQLKQRAPGHPGDAEEIANLERRIKAWKPSLAAVRQQHLF
jgi:hypothetical protein